VTSTYVSRPALTEQPQMSRIKYAGVVFDKYTPAIEGQLLRDCLALQAVGRNAVDEIVVCCDSDLIDPLLSGLGMRRVPTLQLARLWLVYRSGNKYPDVPEWSEETILRDLYVAVAHKNLTVPSDSINTGYYLPPQGRINMSIDTIRRPAPNGYIPVDPALALIWGS